MIFECITDMAKRFEAYFYFDGYGIFQLHKLAGGLFSTPSGTNDDGSTVVNIVQDPNSSDAGLVILGEKNTSTDFNSTVNVISTSFGPFKSRLPYSF